MTIDALTHLQPRAPLTVLKRANGAQNAHGYLLRVIPQIRRHPPVAMIEFQDGIEPVAPELCQRTDTRQQEMWT